LQGTNFVKETYLATSWADLLYLYISESRIKYKELI